MPRHLPSDTLLMSSTYALSYDVAHISLLAAPPFPCTTTSTPSSQRAHPRSAASASSLAPAHTVTAIPPHCRLLPLYTYISKYTIYRSRLCTTFPFTPSQSKHLFNPFSLVNDNTMPINKPARLLKPSQYINKKLERVTRTSAAIAATTQTCPIPRPAQVRVLALYEQGSGSKRKDSLHTTIHLPTPILTLAGCATKSGTINIEAKEKGNKR
ncbi:uncharacterized protein EV420DRAFT_1555156 [Desarmillaria tabescens]|uniref:Uncharacterized protein n=1 Tax=Armillaria tabescens TaxID=1929756 RepID=A0AA39N215_ARMTA|nr:uncharacterized protein EV420DRAFT_1555156 [Desarmillaria tabescens]KAK0455296.1 hypothetical protein EV420DRAFT_1555156 [Desarmillaria tabescens]